MAYRNGTYVAFHAQGTNRPSKSDMDYYRLILAWSAKSDDDFTMVDSHDKTSAVRDSSQKATLKASIQQRLRNSKNMVLIISETTKLDTDWVPFEIEQAIDTYKIPVIASYIDYETILNPSAPELRNLWPISLEERIDNQTAHVIHIPFKKDPILAAIGQFNHEKYPNSGGLGFYGEDAYKQWGLL